MSNRLVQALDVCTITTAEKLSLPKAWRHNSRLAFIYINLKLDCGDCASIIKPYSSLLLIIVNDI